MTEVAAKNLDEPEIRLFIVILYYIFGPVVAYFLKLFGCFWPATQYRPSDRVRKKMKNYAEISGNIMRKKVPIMWKRQQIMRKFPTKRSRLRSSFLKKRSRLRRSLLTKQSRLRRSFQRKVR